LDEHISKEKSLESFDSKRLMDTILEAINVQDKRLDTTPISVIILGEQALCIY
jgi:hypothetical protein